MMMSNRNVNRVGHVEKNDVGCLPFDIGLKKVVREQSHGDMKKMNGEWGRKKINRKKNKK